jgi:hypothetical protein
VRGGARRRRRPRVGSLSTAVGASGKLRAEPNLGAAVTPPRVDEDLPVGLRTQIDDVDYWERVWQMRPASVTISRTDQADFGDRQLIITLDGERLGDLMFGESMSRDVAPGPHTLRVSNTLVWKTVTFEVKPGEQVRFQAINRAGKLTYPLLVVFGAGPLYVTLKRIA